MDVPVWISSGDRRYPDWVALRQRILRDPLGLRYSDEDLAAEAADRHLLQYGDDGELVGGLIVRNVPGEPASWKIRQVAVKESLQGRGIGRILMDAAIDRAREEGVSGIVLHSRAPVVGFYEAIGFHVVGDPFEEVGIPHRKMTMAIDR